MKFKVFDEGDTWGSDIEAEDAEDAACEYAQRDCEYDSECYDLYSKGKRLRVVDENGTEQTVSVSVEFDPMFSARTVKP